ncbi:YciI family protein [Bradyrhizobium sp. USDA 4451]
MSSSIAPAILAGQPVNDLAGQRLNGSEERRFIVQFLVLAHDGTDKDAKARRLAVRPAHLAGIKPMVECGELRAAGAILDAAGDMIGSVILAEFPSRADLDAWLAREPYVTENVWHTVEIRPFRLAVLDGRITP